MRLFLLPISTRRTVLYCERVPQNAPTSGVHGIARRITDRTSQTWATWEQGAGWKRGVTDYGNKLLNRIPFEEWSLKTVPPRSQTADGLAQPVVQQEKVNVIFPGSFLSEQRVSAILRQLATERKPLHRNRFWWSLIGMPLVSPLALVPFVPNLPFFYLAFRAWSHWRALSGAQHLEYLMENNLFQSTPSPVLDEIYAAGLLHSSPAAARAETITPDKIRQAAVKVNGLENEGNEQVMLLSKWNGDLIAERFNLPEMKIETERAIEQVQQSLKEEDLEKKKAEGVATKQREEAER